MPYINIDFIISALKVIEDTTKIHYKYAEKIPVSFSPPLRRVKG